MNLEKYLLGIQKNIPLKNYTTFKIGGKAKYFFVAKNKKDLIRAVIAAKKFKLPLFILGGGSNVLISDKGFNGLVIKIKNQISKIKNTNQKSKIIETEAGALLSQIVAMTTRNNLTGLEWAVGIPGTIGGAIYGNAGAFGSSIGSIVKKVEVFDAKELRIKNYKLENCKFDYRDSIFKHKKNLIILSVIFQLKKGKRKKTEKEIQENLKSRAKKQPLNFPSAGSIFKNPAPKQSLVRGRSTGFSAGRQWRASLSAGELIEKCGLKGKRIGNVKISEKHANFIINLGGGKAKDVKKLINLARKKVKERFRMVLEEEIEQI